MKVQTMSDGSGLSEVGCSPAPREFHRATCADLLVQRRMDRIIDPVGPVFLTRRPAGTPIDRTAGRIKDRIECFVLIKAGGGRRLGYYGPRHHGKQKGR